MVQVLTWVVALLVSVSGLAVATEDSDPGPRVVSSTLAKSGTAVLAFTGDTLIHLPLAARARTESGYDFRPYFRAVRPILQKADLAICHLEVPLSPQNDDLSGYPLFSAPWELAEGLVYAGYDGCSTASNHSFDRGAQGVVDTVDILRQAGLGMAGTSRDLENGWNAAMYQIGDLTVAHISAAYWLNGLTMPPEKQWLVQLLDQDQILAVAARARNEGADLVVVSAHCCVEYLAEPTTSQRELYRDLIQSPNVDLVVGHHSHVLGPIEEIDGEFVVWSLGNFLSAQRQPVTVADGVIAMVRAEQDEGVWRISDVEVVPTWVRPGTYEVVPAAGVNPASFSRTMDMVNRVSEISAYFWLGGLAARLPESY